MRFVADKEERLDQFLVRMLPSESRSRLSKHISQGRVRVGGTPIDRPGHKVAVGSDIEVSPIEASEAHALLPVSMPLEIAFEDEWLIVVNKPAGLSVHPASTSEAPTLVNALLAYSQSLSTASGNFRPGIVHRLDKDTSGLLIVAKTDHVHRTLQQAIQAREITRTYLAWVRGIPEQESFTIRSYLGRHHKNRKRMAVVAESSPDARLAITHCNLVSSGRNLAKLSCRLETGRTHQIRVHLASIGLPVLGDPVYGVAYPGLARQALHSYSLSFNHPVGGTPLTFEAAPPEDLGTIPL